MVSRSPQAEHASATRHSAKTQGWFVQAEHSREHVPTLACPSIAADLLPRKHRGLAIELIGGHASAVWLAVTQVRFVGLFACRRSMCAVKVVPKNIQVRCEGRQREIQERNLSVESPSSSARSPLSTAHAMHMSSNVRECTGVLCWTLVSVFPPLSAMSVHIALGEDPLARDASDDADDSAAAAAAVRLARRCCFCSNIKSQTHTHTRSLTHLHSLAVSAL